MVLRFLFRYFSNNEQLVNKLADSKPIRRAAQMVVYLLNRTSTLSGAHQLPRNSIEFGQQIVGAAKKFSNDFKKELKEAQDELKKKQSK
uniref:Uncharacterized protein n=1 Tax=Trichogramma kaykai TaxID=54128 RepID=A0ABD2XL12_9HYME